MLDVLGLYIDSVFRGYEIPLAQRENAPTDYDECKNPYECKPWPVPMTDDKPEKLIPHPEPHIKCPEFAKIMLLLLRDHAGLRFVAQLSQDSD